MKNPKQFFGELLVVLGFLGFASLLFWPVFGFYFIQDDYVWLSVAKQGFYPFSVQISGFFMPTVYGYFFIAYKLWGNNPFFYYLFNFFLYSINAYLLFYLLKKALFFNKNSALIFSVLFLVLAYSTQTVTWISAVTTLLVMFFLLLSAIFWIKYNEVKSLVYLLAFYIFSILLILTKEWSILLFPFLFTISYLYNYRQNTSLIFKKHSFFVLCPLIILLGFYLFYEYKLQTSGVLLTRHIYSFGPHFLIKYF